MNLAKVKDALVDLETRQRKLIDDVITGLRNVLAVMGDSNGQKKLFPDGMRRWAQVLTWTSL